MSKIIPYNTQTISSSDITSVVKTLKSEYLTQGPQNINLCEKIKKFVGINNVVLVNSASTALHIACLSLGLKKNDWLWTSANTFVASASCGLHCGAKVDLVDIDPFTNNICIKDLSKKLKISKKKNKLPKILVVVHFGGVPCEMKEIFKLSKKYNFKIIEDASHAFGSKYNNFKIGDCKYSDICVFSFHPIKTITTGEGGAILTKNKKISNKAMLLSNHGIERNINNKIKWLYDQKFLGYNFRLSDISASLGISQLNRINKLIKKREKVAEYYYKNLSSFPLILPPKIKNIKNSYHLFVVKFKKNNNKKNRNNFYNFMRKNNIHVQFHYIPLYRHTYFKKMHFKIKDFKNAENYFKCAISLPIYPNLNKTKLKRIIKTIRTFFYNN